ncbi:MULTISPECIES: YceI family protein [Acetobacter]|uniref:Polyisoprenoid-binding protein n=2 Tax=Acetobacter TaxID=434 RepID=A0AAN1U9Y4_9PROT|nr:MULTISPECIES: YceI family protein [Acetobacter]ASL39173.1 polyisoprenoid-binding protein [Acetobacter oryzifermentans]AXN01297.1 polyisoprenoid-binding protein [Acetobacter pomorum]KAA8395090.1 polyisoprenoid-binding protein [Acetobacter sp. DmW_125128]KAA8395528.1 polyisoprenoid-binding protein [Acetobacter sp. DmW_125124]KAA8399879.1 polyisoprenoid-binding protein [Acetobacter sp. DmW_125127]
MSTFFSRPILMIAGLTFVLSTAQAAPAFSAVEQGNYAVDSNHTQVVFSVLHLGFTNYSGFFSNASGTLALDPAQLEASRLSVSIPTDSVLTPSTKLTNELKTSEWLDVAHYPKAEFVSSKITPTGTDTADIEGQFTLHGITQPLTLHARFIGAGQNPMNKTYTVGFQATGELKRSAYGIKTYEPLVADKVLLSIAGAFEKAK